MYAVQVSIHCTYTCKFTAVIVHYALCVPLHRFWVWGGDNGMKFNSFRGAIKSDISDGFTVPETN